MSALAIVSGMTDLGITARVEGRDVALSAPKGTLTPDVVSELKNNKPLLLKYLTVLENRADKDWPEISSDPIMLKAFIEMVMINDMRQMGVVPDHYTSETECSRCGPVPIFKGCPTKIKGCPWCFNRIKGLPIPSRRNQ